MSVIDKALLCGRAGRIVDLAFERTPLGSGLCGGPAGHSADEHPGKSSPKKKKTNLCG